MNFRPPAILPSVIAWIILTLGSSLYAETSFYEVMSKDLYKMEDLSNEFQKSVLQTALLAPVGGGPSVDPKSMYMRLIEQQMKVIRMAAAAMDADEIYEPQWDEETLERLPRALSQWRTFQPSEYAKKEFAKSLAASDEAAKRFQSRERPWPWGLIAILCVCVFITFRWLSS